MAALEFVALPVRVRIPIGTPFGPYYNRISVLLGFFVTPEASLKVDAPEEMFLFGRV